MNLLEILKLYGLPTVAAVVLYVDLRVAREENHQVQIQTVKALENISLTISFAMKEGAR